MPALSPAEETRAGLLLHQACTLAAAPAVADALSKPVWVPA